MPYSKTLLEIVLGLALFWLTFAFLKFSAFGLFDRDSNTYLILAVWVVISFLAWWGLYKWRVLTRRVVAGFFLMLAALVVLYFVPINDNVPLEADVLNEAISAANPDRIDYAQELFFTLSERWTGPTRQYLIEPDTVFFRKDFNFFWNREGEYVDSHVQSQMYRILLLRGNRFADNEVWIEHKGCIHSPHAVVAIRGEDRAVHADLWAVEHFEDYEFGMYTTVPCTELHGRPL